MKFILLLPIFHFTSGPFVEFAFVIRKIQMFIDFYRRFKLKLIKKHEKS